MLSLSHDQSDDAVRALAQGVVSGLSPSDAGEAASLLVALTSSGEKSAVVSAALARKALAELSTKHADQVSKFWEDAHKEALGFLILVMENNPKKSKSVLFQRPDVQSALRAPYEQAAFRSEVVLRTAWEESEKVTETYLKGEFKLLQVDWQGQESDTSLLTALVDDLHANAANMKSRYLNALQGAEDAQKALEKVSTDATRRARYSLSQAVWGHASEVRDAAFARAGLNKMWIARVEDKINPPCSECFALHGTVISPGVDFTHQGKMKTYQGKLIGPPRHPNCRCVIVGTKLKKTKVSA